MSAITHPALNAHVCEDAVIDVAHRVGQGVAHRPVVGPFVDSLGVGRTDAPAGRPTCVQDDGRVRVAAELFIVFPPAEFV
jgi:hypothetical protein